MYVYLEWINDLILTVSKVDLGFFFPFSQHSLQIYCKCYHSNYLLDKITGKNRFNGIIPRAVCGQNVKKSN